MRAIILLHIATGFAIVAVIGHGFVALQYIFFRFSEEAGLPVNATGVSPCENDNSSTGPDDIAKLEWVQKRTAQVSTIYSLITGSLGLLTTIFLGHFSDWKGRKPAAIINSIGNLASIIIFSIIVTLKLPLWVWYLAAIPSGLTGHGFCGFLTLALTMISDLAAGQVEKQNASADPSLSQLDSGESEPSSETPVVCLSETDPPSAEMLQTRTEEANTTRRRLILLGIFDGFVGCIFALAQYAAGEVIQRTGFVVSVGIAIVAGVLALICLLFMPETRVVSTKAMHLPVQMTSSSSSDAEVSSSHRSLGFRSATFLRKPLVILGVLITFFSALILWADVNVSILYLMGKPFCWTSSQVGLYMGLRSASGAVVTAAIFLTMGLSASCCLSRPIEDQASLLGRIPSGGETEEAASASSRLLQCERSRASQRYRRRIITAIVATLGLLAFSRLVFGTAWMAPFPLHNHLTVLALLLGILAFYQPLLNSLISDAVRPEEHGRLFAAMGFSGVLAMLIGTTAQPLIYSATTELCPGAVFIFAFLVLFLSTGLAAQIRGDLMKTYSIVGNRDCALQFDDRFNFASSTNLRGYSLKLRGTFTCLDVRRYSFL